MPDRENKIIKRLKNDREMSSPLKDEFDMANAIMYTYEEEKQGKTKEDETLIDFSSFEKNLSVRNQSYIGIKAIAIEDIVGSLGRYDNFNAKFLPKDGRMNVDKVLGVRSITSFPPIKVYKIHGKYFVIDGHHRVMVSRERGSEFIDAEITKIEVDVDLDGSKEYTFSTDTAKELLVSIERQSFEKRTHLFNDMLAFPIEVTEPSSYGKLHECIMALHNYHLIEQDEFPFYYSALEWYRFDFLPTVRIIVDEKVLRQFPNRKYSDLYIWMHIHRKYLTEMAGYDVSLSDTKNDFIKKFGKDYFFETLPARVMSYLKVLAK